MNAVFTIVAKNYYARARTLGDSIRKHNPDIAFHIILADEFEDASSFDNGAYDITEAKFIGIPDYYEMAFKYSILEFCTAIKPYVFEYLLNTYGYEKIIYFDPDICVFSDLNSIFDELNNSSIAITPHVLNMEIDYTGLEPQEELLFVGIYNLGFVAVKNDVTALSFIKWWQLRLHDKGYADKRDALHVDQRWIDFLPGFCRSGLCISPHLGWNVAVWNVHERELCVKDATYYIKDRINTDTIHPLVFFHFAGFDPVKSEVIHKSFPTSNLTNFPEYKELMDDYRTKHLANNYYDYIKLPYVYSGYSNGMPIIDLHRRLYRVIVEDGCGSKYGNPFLVNDNSYFNLLRKNGLLIDSVGVPRLSPHNTYKTSRMVSILNRILKTIKKIIGIKNYLLLLKIFKEYSTYERQIFLINEYDNPELIEKWRH